MPDRVTADDARPLVTRRRAAEGLIRTAERLFAIHGLDGVSLRQIAVAAGHKNPGAVQYHFGSKTGLVHAIVAYRLPSINARRTQLLDVLDAQARSHDLRGLVDVLARPYLEMDAESYYVELLTRLSAFEGLVREMYESAGADAAGSLSLGERLDVALGNLPPIIRQNRMRMARNLMHNTIANRRVMTMNDARPELSDELFAQELYEGLYAVLTAPHHVRWPGGRQAGSQVEGL